MFKIPISGGPHTGKSELAARLSDEFPQAHIVPEPASRVIMREHQRAQQTPGYKPCLPQHDYAKFAPLVVAESVELEEAIPPDCRLVFLDRSLIDTIAYCRLNNFSEFIPEVRKHITAAGYGPVAFFCDPVGAYATDQARWETPEMARKTHQYLEQAYSESDLEIIRLPAVPTLARIAMVKTVITELEHQPPAP